MSRKLLLAKDDEGYKGPIIYETLTGTGVQAVPSDSTKYALLEDEDLYFAGCKGMTIFNGTAMPSFLGESVGDDGYRYKIKQQSVANPDVFKITTFVMDTQLMACKDWADSLYWDDAEGCYMKEHNVNFIRLDGSDITGINCVPNSFPFHYIPVDGYANTMDQYTAPNVASNWEVTSWSTAYQKGNTLKAVSAHWRTERTNVLVFSITMDNGKYYDYSSKTYFNAEYLTSVLTGYPLNATFPAHNKTPGEKARVERTNLTKKIKLKQYKGGTKYYMIGVDGSEREISISIPTMETKYMPTKQTFSGTDVVVDVGDNYMVDPDGKIYLEWFKANEERSAYNSYYWPLMGEQDDDYNFEYQIVVTPPDGSFVEPVTFKMDYQIINYNLENEKGRPRPIVEWSDTLEKYIFKTSHNYFKITDLNYHPLLGAATVISTTSYSNWPATAFQYKDVPYMDNSVGNGTTADASLMGYARQEGSTVNCGSYYMGYYGYFNHMVYQTGNPKGFTLGIRTTGNSQDRTWCTTTAAGNEQLKLHPVEFVYNYAGYETSYVTHETILNKKVELPYYGPGTTYSMQRLCPGNNTLYKAPICISVPVKYNFKVAYKILEGYAPSVKSNDCYVVRPDQNGYLIEVKGNSRLCWESINGSYSNFTETIKLLGNKVPGGYLYRLHQTTSSGKINDTAFVIPKMLAWYAEGYSGSSLPLQENLTANPMYWDILYWDSSAGCYKIEKRTEYYFADTAYGEVEFVPYLYSNYNLNQGDAWEFLALGYPNYDKSQTDMSRIYSNYITTSFAYNANVDLQYGVVFPVINGTSFGDSYGYNVFDGNGIGFRALNCTSLDALDIYLRSRPLHVITGAYYYNAARSQPFPVIDTNINKQIPIKISDSDAITGTTYTVSNGDLSAKIKIAIPVTYLDVEVPEPTYNLNSGNPQEFTTGSQYVDTKLKLFETAKDFTVLLDYMHKTSQGIFAVNNGVVFHCRYEAAKSPYNYCGLSIQAGSAPTTYMYGGQGSTNYHPGIIADSTGTGRLTMYDGSSYRYRIIIVYKAGIPYKIAQVNESGDILFEYAINENHKQTFTAHSRPLYLGCQIAATSTSRSNYFKGTINECKVWDGTALTDAQIMKVVGAGPYSKPIYELTNYSLYSHDTLVRTDLVLLESKRDLSILLDFDVNSNNKLNNKAYVASYGHRDYSTRLAITYKRDTDSYYVEFKDNNALEGDIALPVVNGRCRILINFKAGGLDEVYDLSGEKPRRLAVKSSAKTPGAVDFVFVLGYLPDTEDTATNRDPHLVWYGHINNCMVWYDKVVTTYELEYLCKYIY